MAWNEPGHDKKEEQWKKTQKAEEGPPDLDELLQKVGQKMRFFGGKKKSNSGSGGGDSQARLGWLGPFLIFMVLIVIWFVSGFYLVQPAEQAAVLRFGRYVETVGPGLHWVPMLVESKKVVNVDKVDSFRVSGQMLTQGENIVFVDVAVQFKIDTAAGKHGVRDYLYNVVNPVNTLQEVTNSAIRQVIGESTLDEVLTTGREQVRQEIRAQIQKTLERFHTGLEVVSVAMQPAKAPDEVKEAFDDVIKAREDRERVIDLANAYANRVVPVAQGQASRIETQAVADAQRIVDQASGEVARFDALIPQYRQNPNLLSERLYLQTLESVLSQNKKVFLDTGKADNLISLPLNEMMSTPLMPSSMHDVNSSSTVNSSTKTKQKKTASSAGVAGYQQAALLRWQEAQQ